MRNVLKSNPERPGPKPTARDVAERCELICELIDGLLPRLARLRGTVSNAIRADSPAVQLHFADTLKGWVSRVGGDMTEIGTHLINLHVALRNRAHGKT